MKQAAASLVEKISTTFGGSLTCVDYAQSFTELWRFENIEPGPLVIVWSGMPDPQEGDIFSPVNGNLLLEHLTPLDWALVASRKLLEHGEPPALSIHIVDLSGLTWKSCFAIRMRHQMLADMPWVRLYAPLSKANYVGFGLLANYRPLAALQGGLIALDDVGCPRMVVDEAPTLDNYKNGNEIKKALDYLNTTWRATIARGEGHHDINNIIGPEILLSMLSAEGREHQSAYQTVNAFMSRIEWIRPLQEVREDSPNETVRAEFVQPVNLLVIDDQLSMGWDQVLAKLVHVEPNLDQRRHYNGIERIGCSQKLDLYGATGPEVLFQALGLLVSDGVLDVDVDLYKQRKYDSPLPEEADLSRPWALILDLRLFSGKENIEKNWYRQLAAIASRIDEKAGDNLAWKGFDSDHLDILQKDFEFDEGLIDTALSLLPRLCALRWPAVPIIVFSASGRRGLTSILAEYGNIFLSSPKPNVLSVSPEDQLEAFLAGWGQDVQRANSLLMVQKELWQLMPSGRDSIPGLFDGEKHTHIVVALDETGDFISYDSSVGGVVLFATGDDESSAIEAAKSFQESLRKNGASFYKRTPYYTDAASSGEYFDAGSLSKGGSIAEKLRCTLEDYKENVKLSVFQYTIPKKNFTDPNLYADASYLKGLAACLELIFFELLPSVGVQRQTCSIWIPTKQASYLTPYYHEAAESEYDRVFEEGKRKGVEYNKRRADAKTAKREIKKKLEREHAQDAVSDALRESRRFDFRLTRGGLVETIGGLGKAYSMLLQTLSVRSSYEEVFKGIKSIKVRKIPYDLDTRGRAQELGSHNVSVCGDCGHIRSEGKQCNRDGCNGALAADYSVMAHVADAAISPNPEKFYNADEIGDDNMDMALSFDVNDSHDLDDFLHVSRLMDANRVSDAFKLAFRRQFFSNGLNRTENDARAGIERRLVGELKAHSPHVSGVDLMELSGLPARNIMPNSGQVSNRSGIGKSVSKPKYRKEQPTNRSQGDGKQQNRKMGQNVPSKNNQGKLRVSINHVEDMDASLSAIEVAVSGFDTSAKRSRNSKGKPRIQLIIDSGHSEKVMQSLHEAKSELNEGWVITANTVD